MLGYEPEEWTSTPNFWLKLVPPEDRENAARVAAAMFAAGEQGENEFRWVAKDGHVIWVLAKSSVIKNAKGKPVGMRGVTLDITDRKNAERHLALLAEDLHTRRRSLQLHRFRRHHRRPGHERHRRCLHHPRGRGKSAQVRGV